MDDINKKIYECKLCGDLQKLTENTIQIGTTPFVIIGESPAKDGWIQSKKAFYNIKGKLQSSGRVLEKLLNVIGLSIKDVYFTECCKCIIDDRKNLEKCSNNCRSILVEQLNNLPCRIILTMGLHPTQAILQTKIKKYADIVGTKINVQLGKYKYLLIPIYHTSPLNPKGYKDNILIFKMLDEIIKDYK